MSSRANSASPANLAGLVSARESFQLEMAQSSVPWRVIAPPVVSRKPIKPSLQKSLPPGIVLALIAGIGVALLRDRFDRVFHQAGEVKDELGLPLLGHVPHVEFFQGVREDKRFLLNELDDSVSDSRAANDTTDHVSIKHKRYQRFSIKRPSAICSPASLPEQRQACAIDCSYELRGRRQVTRECAARQNTF